MSVAIRHVIRKIASRKCYSSFVSRNMAGEDVSLQRVLSVLEDFAPKHLAASWDNTGLLVEPYTRRNITKILLTNDLTEEVALEANSNGCEMIISYHPPIFAPLKSVVQSSWKEKTVSFLLENRISLYSPHTSWDNVQGGVNDWLGSAFPGAECGPIPDRTDGMGRLIRTKESMALGLIVDLVKQLTGLKHVRIAFAPGKNMSDKVNTIALCAGSGSSVLQGAKADVYLTGEMQHHDILDAAQRGVTVILTNHSDSERGFLKVFSPKLEEMLGNEVKVIVSKFDKDPLITV